MRWLHPESVFKGVFLGLLLFVALHEEDWQSLGMLVLFAVGGLALGLGIGGYRKLREGYRIRNRLFSFILFLLLECPGLVYAGILLGIGAGALFLRRTEADTRALVAAVAGGTILGILFGALRYVRRRPVRLGLSLVLAGLLVTAALLWLGQLGEYGQTLLDELGWNNPLRDRAIFGTQLLVGIPLFYLLTFAGREEETEVEFGAICAALGVGGFMLVGARLQTASLIVPFLLYLGYSTQILPKLRVVKHALRGFSYSQIGRHRQAILSFRRALQYDPNNALAREGLWSVHRAMDLSQLADDPQTLAVVDMEMCLERAGSLLLEPSPSEAKLSEANRLLNLVQDQRPDTRPRVHYWRAVALTHGRQYDRAAAELEQILDPTGQLPNNPQREVVLLQAWQLALRLHPELARRVGAPQLALPGRRMEAIRAVERHLGGNPDDADVRGFKRLLYQDLTGAEFSAAVSPGADLPVLDYDYAQQLGLALINNSTQWRRGAEYLGIAAIGLPGQAPTIYTQVAAAQQREKDPEGAWESYERAKKAGLAVGPKNLDEANRQAYFAAVKLLAEAAQAHGEIQLALDNYQLYLACERSGVETFRAMADLYEKQGDALAALWATEQGLVYNAADKDFLERKDRYYYSVMPDDLRARLDSIRRGFDVAYCLKKSRALLDAKNWDLDTLDWAQHLAELARVVQPDSLAAKVSLARIRFRRGEKEEAVALFEEVHTPRPEKFASSEDEEAWFLSCRFLGEIYLFELHQPDLAVECFKSYRQSPKSGADTIYKLGQAYEALGDRERAAKHYEHVVSYDGHPLAPDARDALYRLQAN
jgi:tetratricopeptide (TPR) repeat protein